MPPTLNHISPNGGTRGESFNIVIDGQEFQNGASVTLGEGVIVSDVIFRSTRQLLATVEIMEAAAYGARDITMTNPGDGVTAFENKFTILDRPKEDRKVFLLAMYTQMWKNIDTHILVVWQSVAAVLGSFAIFSLVEKGFLPIDIASVFIVILSGWLIAHVYDAWEWFHRNLVILTNIERQFLRPSDLTAINPFFSSHRSPGHMLAHLKIQQYLGLGIVFIVLTYHFLVQVLPGFDSPWHTFLPIRCLPYVATFLTGILLLVLRRKVLRSNRSVTAKSPGLHME